VQQVVAIECTLSFSSNLFHLFHDRTGREFPYGVFTPALCGRRAGQECSVKQ
jgi:hypothetical protein